MDFIKTALTSKTNWAIFVSLLSGLIGKYGFEISPVLQGQVADVITSAITVGAAVYATKRHTDLKAA